MYLYEIRNKVDGKRYVGQTSNPQRRFNVHRCKLRKGKSHNEHLQNAWNKYGEQNFEFNILTQYKSLSSLNTAERKLINLKEDYNIEPGGGVFPISEETCIKISKAKRKKPYPTIVASDGSKHKIEPTLEEFCRRNGLWASDLRAMLAGRINYAKGWHLTTTKMSMEEAWSKRLRKYEYPIVVDPLGTEHKITNLRKFVRDHKLGDHFKGMVRGKRQQYKGWHIKGKMLVDPNILRSQALRGENHHGARVTEKQVLEMRREHEDKKLSLRRMAKIYNLPKTTIWNIIHHKTWKHI